VEALFAVVHFVRWLLARVLLPRILEISCRKSSHKHRVAY
jgi:hypothetical protein